MKIKWTHSSSLLMLFSFIILFSHAQTTTGEHQARLTDNPLKSKLDSLVDKSVKTYFENSSAVGVSIGIIKNNVTYFYNYGETEFGNGHLPTNKTLYEIGSTTKSFTGIILAQAVLDNKINLNDDIRKYLKGDYPNLQYKDNPIKMVHLANHTCRITRIFPNLWERPAYDSLNPLSNYSRTLLFEGLHKMKMDTFPGVVDSYSNMGVGVLGTILEDIYNETYFSLISKFILQPLEMNDTRINISGVDDGTIAKAHVARKTVPYWDMPDLPAVGALRSTTMDLVKYIYANNADSIAAIHLSHQLTFGTDQKGMGLNWFIYTTENGYKAFGHAGGTGGSRSSLQCFPELKSGFVILTNSLANRKDLEKELVKIVTE